MDGDTMDKSTSRYPRALLVAALALFVNGCGGLKGGATAPARTAGTLGRMGRTLAAGAPERRVRPRENVQLRPFVNNADAASFTPVVREDSAAASEAVGERPDLFADGVPTFEDEVQPDLFAGGVPRFEDEMQPDLFAAGVPRFEDEMTPLEARFGTPVPQGAAQNAAADLAAARARQESVAAAEN
jgi:hypothetical protein